MFSNILDKTMFGLNSRKLLPTLELFELSDLV